MKTTDLPFEHVAALAEPQCFHCGLPVPDGSSWTVPVDGFERACCCPGCAAVARAIIDGGGADYYNARTAFATTPALAAEDEARFALYDSDPQQFAGRAAPGQWEAAFSVEGIRCAACTWLIEQRLAQVEGVASATMNAATGRLHVVWDEDRCAPSAILSAVHAIGYRAWPYDPRQHAGQLDRERKTLFRRAFVAGLSMMQVMMYALPAYVADDGTLDASMAGLLQWASLFLTLPAIVYSARPFFSGALASLRARSLGMDVPVALGIAAAFIGSVVATVQGSGDVYFDSVTMFVFLLLCSRYLELGARRKAASALDRLLQGAAESGWRVAAWPHGLEAALVPAAQLQPGDVVLVKPGEAVPADGVLLPSDPVCGTGGLESGGAALDLSLLTGESEPQTRSVGEEIPGGAVNRGQPLHARIVRPARDSTLALLARLAARAGQGKPRLALWADQVAGWFVLALMVLAGAVWVFWHWHDAARAWPIAVAVLVVSCPCALSLAMPTALAAATDTLLRKGVLVMQPHVLETLQRATHIVFDKTGTLTEGRPTITATATFGGVTGVQALALAAALEQASAHPLAHAFVSAAPDALPSAYAARHVPGMGVEGEVDGTTYRLGSRVFVEALAGPSPNQEEGGVWLGRPGAWLARFTLEDALRGDAPAVIRRFRAMGKELVLLSGDADDAVQRTAHTLGIEHAYGSRLPEEKLALVQQLQTQGAVVAMVGDGINDAAVLQAADVSFAMGSGAALAQTHADCVLMSGRLSALADAASMARRSARVIRQNLAWATLYNVIAIPAAAFGLLTPWMSGLGMSLSSAAVVINALRLRRGQRNN